VSSANDGHRCCPSKGRVVLVALRFCSRVTESLVCADGHVGVVSGDMTWAIVDRLPFCRWWWCENKRKRSSSWEINKVMWRGVWNELGTILQFLLNFSTLSRISHHCRHNDATTMGFKAHVSSLGMFFFSSFFLFLLLLMILLNRTTVAEREGEQEGVDGKGSRRWCVSKLYKVCFFLFSILFFAVLRLTKVAASTNMAPSTAPQLE
jgi:hypothetical protein